MLLYPSMLLCEAIEEHPGLIPVVGRFGIRLGVGEKSIEQIATDHGIDPVFFIVVLNTLLNESYFPEKKLLSFDIAQIVDYLSKTNDYYISSQLPNIEKHLRAFIAEGRSGNNSLEILGNLLDDFKKELYRKMEQDRTMDFPDILSGKRVDAPGEEDICEELLAEMRTIIVRFLTGDYNQNLCFGVVFTITTMQRDMAQNNRIRHRILYPMAATR